MPIDGIDWGRDHVPNFLWAGGFVTGNVDRGLTHLAKVLDRMKDFAEETGMPIAPEGMYLDGGLLALERVPEETRPHLLAYLRSHRLADEAASEGFVHSIRMYPGAPGWWLSLASAGEDLHVDPEIAERHLTSVLRAILLGQSAGATAVKANFFRQTLLADRLRFAPGTISPDELERYPNRLTTDERAAVDATLRAMYGALSVLDEDSSAGQIEWAQTFWRSNWNLYVCKQRTADPADPGPIDDPAELDGIEAAETSAVEEGLGELWFKFLELAGTTDPDVYDPSGHEVVTGIAAHAIRTCIAVVAQRGLWIGEFSAPLLRGVAEAIVVLRWLTVAPEADAGIFRRYKEFGRGHLKLMKLHAEDIADRIPGGSDVLEDVIDRLDEEVNAEVREEFQDISLEATFSGRDLRKMALAAGTEDLYRVGIAPMSSVMHSEWPTLQRYAMRPCLNLLHRFHWIPRDSLSPSLRPVAAQSAASLAAEVVEAYKAVLAKLSGGSRGDSSEVPGS